MTYLKPMDPNILIKQWAGVGRTLDIDVAHYEVWNLLVHAYSMTSLTVPGDKLVALSGIAKRFMSVLADVYVAGMWRKYLENSLLWCVFLEDQIVESPSSRPATYRAPTWSWASVDGVIRMGTVHRGVMVITVDDVVLKHATADTTGVVTGGWLDLVGQLRPMQLQQKDHKSRDEYFIIVNNNFVCSDEAPEEYEDQEPSLHFDVPPKGDAAFRADNSAHNLFFMVCRMPSADYAYLQILLLRLADIEKKLFERIGTAMFRSSIEQELLLAEQDDDIKSSLPCLRYENGLHTIRII
jgi:hypothetical protein